MSFDDTSHNRNTSVALGDKDKENPARVVPKNQMSRKRQAPEEKPTLFIKPKAVRAKNPFENEESTHWKRLFWNAQKEKTTVVEQQLYRFMKDSEKREDALRTYIRCLESDLKQSTTDLKSAKAKNEQLRRDFEISNTNAVMIQKEKEHYRLTLDKTERELVDVTASLDQKTTDFQDLRLACRLQHVHIDFYKMMTGMEIKVVDQNAFECSMLNTNINTNTDTNGNNHRIVTTFMLSLLDESADLFRFDPLSGCEIFPDFLHGPIEFERSQCPPLLNNILKVIYPDED